MLILYRFPQFFSGWYLPCQFLYFNELNYEVYDSAPYTKNN